MRLILKLLCLGLLELFSSQLAQATTAAPGPLPGETCVAMAERFASNPALRALAVDADKLCEYWNDFANTLNTVPPGLNLQLWQDTCRRKFIKNVIELHIKITDALLVLPEEMRHDDLIVEMSISYTNLCCPVFCKNWLEIYGGAPERCELISSMLRLHYIVCNFLYAVSQDTFIQNFDGEAKFTLAEGLEPFRKGDGTLKTADEFSASTEAQDPKSYFEHWYGDDAFVAPLVGGGEGAVTGEEGEDGEVLDSASGAQ